MATDTQHQAHVGRQQMQDVQERRGLNVHHSSYVHRGEFGIVGMAMEWLDTITLCSECHSRIHENRSIKEFAD